VAQKRFVHHEKWILSKLFKSCYEARGDDLSRLLTYNFALMNVMTDPIILATTNPHQAPTRPQPNTPPKILLKRLRRIIDTLRCFVAHRSVNKEKIISNL